MSRAAATYPSRFAIGLLALLAPWAAFAAKGGPDSGGYTWADQNETGVDAAIPPDTAAPVQIPLAGEQVSAPIDLGFTFPFYGRTYTRFVVSSNGWISFDTTVTNPVPVGQALPVSFIPNAVIAFFWRDLDAPDLSQYTPFAGGGSYLIRTKPKGASGPSIALQVALY